MCHMKFPVRPSISNMYFLTFLLEDGPETPPFLALASLSMLIFDPALGKFITQPQLTMTWSSEQTALPQFQHCRPWFSLSPRPKLIPDFSISPAHNPFSSPISRPSWKWQAVSFHANCRHKAWSFSLSSLFCNLKGHMNYECHTVC